MSHITYHKNVGPYDRAESRNKRTRLNQVRLILLSFVLCLGGGLNLVLAQQCVRQNPTVTITPSSQSGFAGQQFAFTVTVTNNDSAGCPPSRFIVMPAFPDEGFMHTPDCIRFTLRPGESRSRTVIVKSPKNACTGPKTFRETAINEDDPSFSGTAEAVINVTPIVPDCGRANPTVRLVPMSQEAFSGTEVTYTITITNNDNPACGASIYNITASLPEDMFVEDRVNFNLLILPGESKSKAVQITSDLFASGTLMFTVTATNVQAPCFSASATGIFQTNGSIVTLRYCCRGGQTLGTGGKRFTFCTQLRPDVPFPGLACSLLGGFIVDCKGSYNLDDSGAFLTITDTNNACSGP